MRKEDFRQPVSDPNYLVLVRLMLPLHSVYGDQQSHGPVRMCVNPSSPMRFAGHTLKQVFSSVGRFHCGGCGRGPCFYNTCWVPASSTTSYSSDSAPIQYAPADRFLLRVITRRSSPPTLLASNTQTPPPLPPLSITTPHSPSPLSAAHLTKWPPNLPPTISKPQNPPLAMPASGTPSLKRPTPLEKCLPIPPPPALSCDDN